MNEIIFIIYCLVVVSSLLIALRLSKEALIALISLLWVLANLFITQQIYLCRMTATSSDALVVGALLGLNLLQEYYGKATARSSIKISFYMLIFYTVVSLLHCAYIPHPSDQMHSLFKIILTPMPRILIASGITFILTQYLEYFLYGTLKQYLAPYLVTRNIISISISQLFDTVVFTFLGLYGTVSYPGQIILVSYGIKMLTLLLSAPFIRLSRYIITDKRGKDTSNVHI